MIPVVRELTDPLIAAEELRGLGFELHEDPVALPGGVSNRVFRASTARGDVVMKQSIERLMVVDEWLAPRERIGAEAAAMRLVHGMSPDHAPELLAQDRENFVLIMSAAPTFWTDWKVRLRRSDVDVAVAHGLGDQLGRWHEATRAETLPQELEDDARFDDLRLRPYFATTAQRRPDIAAELNSVVAAIRSRRECLVHGDFSPKNVLTDGREFWVTDFEVAHHGDPTFDVAFLISHLLLKAEAQPADRIALQAAADTFLTAYEVSVGRPMRDAHLAGVVAALLAARVDGKSTVDYLTPARQSIIRARSALWLRHPDRLWTWWG